MTGESDAPAFDRIAIIGAGAWGTALAILCAGQTTEVLLCARTPSAAAALESDRENAARLPGAPLPPNVRPIADLAAAAAADAVIYAAPAQAARAHFVRMAEAGAVGPCAIAAKGIDLATGQLLPDVMAQVWPAAAPAMLSGPSFAADVATGRPTAVTLACRDERVGARWTASLHAPQFRPYQSTDVTGAALGGAVKNVIAIAAGAVVGAGLGDSARAAVIARGFAEFQRLGAAIGARSETMAGLSGLGDLILTATSTMSRNMSFGLALGRDGEVKSAEGGGATTEGVATAEAALRLAGAHEIEMPICRSVAALVAGRAKLSDLIDDLLARPLTSEG